MLTSGLGPGLATLETLVHQQVWESGAKWENNKQCQCLLTHFPLTSVLWSKRTSLMCSRCYVNYYCLWSGFLCYVSSTWWSKEEEEEEKRKNPLPNSTLLTPPPVCPLFLPLLYVPDSVPPLLFCPSPDGTPPLSTFPWGEKPVHVEPTSHSLTLLPIIWSVWGHSSGCDGSLLYWNTRPGALPIYYANCCTPAIGMGLKQACGRGQETLWSRGLTCILWVSIVEHCPLKQGFTV